MLVLASVPFLLLVRQCRYYSLDAFFATLALYGYYNLLEKRKWSGLTFFLGAFFLFHSHYVHCAVLLVCVLLHCLVWRRDRLLAVAGLSGLVGLLNVPWMIWFAGMGQQVEAFGTPMRRLQTFGSQLVRQFEQFIFPPLVLILVVPAVLAKWMQGRRFPMPDRKSVQDVSLLLLFITASVLASALTVTFPFFRVLASIIPAALLLLALVIHSSMRVHVIIGIAAIAGLAFGMRMPDYAYEMTHDFRGPIDGIVKYLNEQGKPSDVVAITYGDLPLKFYTKMRVVGGLTGEDLSPIKKAQWVIVRKYLISNGTIPVLKYMRDNVDVSKYERIQLDYPDTPFENREDPAAHRYRTAAGEDPVVIWHRVW